MDRNAHCDSEGQDNSEFPHDGSLMNIVQVLEKQKKNGEMKWQGQFGIYNKKVIKSEDQANKFETDSQIEVYTINGRQLAINCFLCFSHALLLPVDWRARSQVKDVEPRKLGPATSLIAADFFLLQVCQFIFMLFLFFFLLSWNVFIRLTD